MPTERTGVTGVHRSALTSLFRLSPSCFSGGACRRRAACVRYSRKRSRGACGLWPVPVRRAAGVRAGPYGGDCTLGYSIAMPSPGKSPELVPLHARARHVFRRYAPSSDVADDPVALRQQGKPHAAVCVAADCRPEPAGAIGLRQVAHMGRGLSTGCGDVPALGPPRRTLSRSPNTCWDA